MHITYCTLTISDEILIVRMHALGSIEVRIFTLMIMLVNITSMPLLQRRRLQCDCCKETNLDLLTAGGCAFLLLLFMAHPLCVQIQMSGKGSTPNNLHGYEIQTRIFLPSAAWCLLPEPNYSQQSKISKVLQFRY